MKEKNAGLYKSNSTRKRLMPTCYNNEIKESNLQLSYFYKVLRYLRYYHDKRSLVSY